MTFVRGVPLEFVKYDEIECIYVTCIWVYLQIPTQSWTNVLTHPTILHTYSNKMNVDFLLGFKIALV